MSVQNPPKQHHYIPVFYLSRWAVQSDNQLCQFSRPFNKVVPKRKHPSATGYLDRLYELDGLEGDLAQQVESKFFSPVDSAAADALSLMEQQGNRAVWNQRRRSAWSRFLHSMLLRTPEDLETFKASWRSLMLNDKTDEWEARYEEIKQPGDKLTFREFVAGISEESHNRSAMHALMGMIDNPRLGLKINNMPWWVIDTDPDDHPLLTSDRPVIRTNGLNAPNGHIALPIGPYRIFVVAKDQQTLNVIRSANIRQIVREVNRQVCDYAVKYVYGIDDRHIDFVKKHFATKEQPRLLASASNQRAEMEDRMLALQRSTSVPFLGGRGSVRQPISMDGDRRSASRRKPSSSRGTPPDSG